LEILNLKNRRQKTKHKHYNKSFKPLHRVSKNNLYLIIRRIKNQEFSDLLKKSKLKIKPRLLNRVYLDFYNNNLKDHYLTIYKIRNLDF